MGLEQRKLETIPEENQPEDSIGKEQIPELEKTEKEPESFGKVIEGPWAKPELEKPEIPEIKPFEEIEEQLGEEKQPDELEAQQSKEEELERARQNLEESYDALKTPKQSPDQQEKQQETQEEAEGKKFPFKEFYTKYKLCEACKGKRRRWLIFRCPVCKGMGSVPEKTTATSGYYADGKEVIERIREE